MLAQRPFLWPLTSTMPHHRGVVYLHVTLSVTTFPLLVSQMYPSKVPSGETATSNDDATAHSVSRFLRAKEEIGAKPMRHARDAVGNGNERSTLGTRTGDDCGFPRELDVKPHEGTRAQQNEGEVACAGIQG